MSEKLQVNLQPQTFPEISQLCKRANVFIGIIKQYLENNDDEEERDYCKICFERLYHVLEKELHELIIVQKQDITTDDFCEFLANRISMYMFETIFNINDELLRRKSVIKALECGKDCVDNQPDYVVGYKLYSSAFFYLIDFAKFDLVVNDENERNYVKQVIKYGRQVAESFRFALENANVPNKEFHELLLKILKELYSTPKDLMPGEESEEFSLSKELANMVNIFKNQSNSAIIQEKGKEYLEAFHLNNVDQQLESKTFTLVIQIMGLRPLIWRRIYYITKFA